MSDDSLITVMSHTRTHTHTHCSDCNHLLSVSFQAVACIHLGWQRTDRCVSQFLVRFGNGWLPRKPPLWDKTLFSFYYFFTSFLFHPRFHLVAIKETVLKVTVLTFMIVFCFLCRQKWQTMQLVSLYTKDSVFRDNYVHRKNPSNCATDTKKNLVQASAKLEVKIYKTVKKRRMYRKLVSK